MTNINKFSDVATDNPLGRLYNFIYQLKSSSVNTEVTFSRVFSIEENDQIAILTHYSHLIKLCDLGIESIEKLNPKRIDKYKQTLEEVREGLAKIQFGFVYSNGSLNAFRNHFNSELLNSLENCADYLSERNEETVVEEESLVELIDEINHLEHYILTSELDVALKKVLIYQLQMIKDSIFKYKFYGDRDMEDMFATTLGKLILNQDKVKTIEDKNVIGQIFGLMAKINSIFSIRDNSIKLVESIINKVTQSQ